MLKTIKDVEIAMKAGTIRSFAQVAEESTRIGSIDNLPISEDEMDARWIYIFHIIDNPGTFTRLP